MEILKSIPFPDLAVYKMGVVDMGINILSPYTKSLIDAGGILYVDSRYSVDGNPFTSDDNYMDDLEALDSEPMADLGYLSNPSNFPTPGTYMESTINAKPNTVYKITVSDSVKIIDGEWVVLNVAFPGGTRLYPQSDIESIGIFNFNAKPGSPDAGKETKEHYLGSRSYNIIKTGSDGKIILSVFNGYSEYRANVWPNLCLDIFNIQEIGCVGSIKNVAFNNESGPIKSVVRKPNKNQLLYKNIIVDSEYNDLDNWRVFYSDKLKVGNSLVTTTTYADKTTINIHTEPNTVSEYLSGKRYFLVAEVESSSDSIESIEVGIQRDNGGYIKIADMISNPVKDTKYILSGLVEITTNLSGDYVDFVVRYKSNSTFSIGDKNILHSKPLCLCLDESPSILNFETILDRQLNDVDCRVLFEHVITSGSVSADVVDSIYLDSIDDFINLFDDGKLNFGSKEFVIAMCFAIPKETQGYAFARTSKDTNLIQIGLYIPGVNDEVRLYLNDQLVKNMSIDTNGGGFFHVLIHATGTHIDTYINFNKGSPVNYTTPIADSDFTLIGARNNHASILFPNNHVKILFGTLTAYLEPSNINDVIAVEESIFDDYKSEV